MLAIYIVTFLVLMDSDVLPSKVYAGSGGSRDSSKSSVSNDSGDESSCKNALKKINSITKKVSLPACKCGPSGTICKVDILNAQNAVATVLTCSGCTGPQVPITSSTECNNVATIFRPDLDKYFLNVYPRCKNVKIFRCGCPAVSTTAVPTKTVTTPVSVQPVSSTSKAPITANEYITESDKDTDPPY